MKNQSLKFTSVLSALLYLTAVIVLFAPVTSSAQILKPGEVIYSRVPIVSGNCATAAIWVVGLDGSNDRFITQGMHPRISPDGRLILFKRFDPKTLCSPFFNGQPEWWIRDLTTRQETQIALNFGIAFGHFFSPETNRADKQITTDDVNGLCTMKLDGSNRVCTGIPTLDPIRSPGHMGVRGGDNLIVVENYDNTPAGGLYTLNYNDLLNRQKIPNTNFSDVNPSWSNDGQTIAYATTNVLNRGQAGPFVNLFKINPDGSNNTQLTFLNNLPVGEGFYHSLVWTLDNSTILNAAKLNGIAGIYKISANGGGVLGTILITPGAAPEWVGGIAPAYSEQQVASFGGGLTSGGNYSLVDTIGQAFAGQTSTGGTYNLQSGFWTNAVTRRSRADFDGDGKTDLSVYRPSDGNWYAFKSDGSGALVRNWGIAGDVLTPGDFDGDGKVDTAAYRPSSGQWYIFRSSDSTVNVLNFGIAGDRPVAGDYDGDGETDVAQFRPSQGVWYVFRSSDNGVSITTWGEATDLTVPADYDGDGKTDVAVFRPSTGVWYVFRSTAGPMVVGWGIAGDKPVEADYDGDGKDDVAIYRPSEGNWYVFRSSDNSVQIVNWGNATDVPSPGDYDGDGKNDFAVFRNGTWFAYESTAGPIVSSWGATGDSSIPARYLP